MPEMVQQALKLNKSLVALLPGVDVADTNSAFSANLHKNMRDALAKMYVPKRVVWKRPHRGDKVELTPDYKSHGGTRDGFALGDVGEIVEDNRTSNPFKVAFNGREFRWFYERALQKAGAQASSTTVIR